MTHKTLVSTDTLASNLDSTWVVVDCRYDLARSDWGRAEYEQGHIPGAAYASLSHDLAGSPDGSNGRHPIPSHDQMAATFGRLGIGPRSQVVIYDQDTGIYASRMWWMLRYLGHDAAAVLDGGWAKWMRERKPTRAGTETSRAATFTPRARPELRVTLADVEARVRDRAALLVDARAAERFEGQSETLDRIAGHIPGAANHFYKQNLSEDGTMLPPDALRAKFQAALGECSPNETVMYCGSGVTACHNLLAMEHAGLGGAPLYPGSWSEWSSDPKRPVETGAARTGNS